VEDPVEKVLREGVIVALANHTLLIRKDGTELPIDDSGAPIRNAKGDVEGVVLVFRDFSKHRQVEQELRKAIESAESANQAKDSFLAMVSHELRTPLSPVLTTLHHWETSDRISPEIKADVQMLRRNVELEARIIDDLLDLTRITRGMLAVFPEPTDVHSLIAALLEVSGSDFASKNLQLVSRLAAQQHIVHADASRLQQVVSNILHNAVKFTDPGGTITVRTSNDDGRRIAISVSDTGMGMSPEILGAIFTPFEQGGRERSRRSGGLGLGMSIARALVELMEGSLVAESPGVGHGSTITITLPVSECLAKAVPPPSQFPVVMGKGSILLVEDHADSAAALARLLRARGYEVITSESVADALKLFQENNFSLLVCDVGLPDGTGYELVQHVRTRSKIPAIALTGFGMHTDIEKAQRSGFDAHLTKPVNLQKLEATISTLMDGKGLEKGIS
jgi:signal transduction histidine kinase/ActR/RegA family two-component response regulator